MVGIYLVDCRYHVYVACYNLLISVDISFGFAMKGKKKEKGKKVQKAFTGNRTWGSRLLVQWPNQCATEISTPIYLAQRMHQTGFDPTDMKIDFKI